MTFESQIFMLKVSDFYYCDSVAILLICTEIFWDDAAFWMSVQ